MTTFVTMTFLLTLVMTFVVMVMMTFIMMMLMMTYLSDSLVLLVGAPHISDAVSIAGRVLDLDELVGFGWTWMALNEFGWTGWVIQYCNSGLQCHCQRTLSLSDSGFG